MRAGEVEARLLDNALFSVVPIFRLVVLWVTDLPRGHDGRGQVLQQVALVERQLVDYDVVLSRRVDHCDMGMWEWENGKMYFYVHTHYVLVNQYTHVQYIYEDRISQCYLRS